MTKNRGDACKLRKADSNSTMRPSSPKYGRGKRTRNGTKRVDYRKLAGEDEDFYGLTAMGNEYCQSSIAESEPQASTISKYANKHIPRIIERSPDTSSAQIVTDGSTLTARNLKDPKCFLSLNKYILILDSPESIGIQIPRLANSDNLTVRHLGNIIGMDHPITVIDVRHQEEMDGWTLGDLVEYFEDEDRIYQNASMNRSTSNSSNEVAPISSRQLVLNQISLEFSHTPLKQLVRSPQFVRDLDWIDIAWPKHRKRHGDFPTVQYYCLTSTAGCYTDFHIDFGGSSVWYHVISGEKVFLILPPTQTNIQLYEMWLCSQNQNNIFFLDMEHNGQTPQHCNKVILKQGQTFIIPGGWIHAVYTPLDSIVFGGNFLHGLDINGQIETFCLEKRIRVPTKFRFPNFIRMMFYAVAHYFQRMTSNQPEQQQLCKEEIEDLPKLTKALRIWSIQPQQDINRDGTIAQTIHECLSMFRTDWTFDDLLNSIDDYIDNLREKQLQSFYGSMHVFDYSPNQTTPIQPSTPHSIPILDKPKLKFKISTASVTGASTALTPSEQCSDESNKTYDSCMPKTVSSSSPSLISEASNDNIHVSSSSSQHVEDFLYSASSPVSSASTKRKVRKIEDLQSRQMHTNEDEEWVPGNEKKNRRKTNRRMNPHYDRPSDKSTFELKSVRRKPKSNISATNGKTLTARQRLSKKFNL